MMILCRTVDDDVDDRLEQLTNYHFFGLRELTSNIQLNMQTLQTYYKLSSRTQHHLFLHFLLFDKLKPAI